jgi:hypothetical protein
MPAWKSPNVCSAILAAGLALFILCAPPISPLQKIGRLEYCDAAPVYIVNRQITPDTLTYIGEKATTPRRASAFLIRRPTAT